MAYKRDEKIERGIDMKKHLLFVVLLLSVVITILSGCQLDDSEDYEVNDNLSELQQKVYIANESHQILDTELYNYWHTDIIFPRILTIEISNKNNNEFEIFVLSADDFLLYQSNEAFTGYTISIDGNESSTETINLDSGRYFIVIDNTYKGNVLSPQGIINNLVRYEVSIYYEKESIEN